MANGGRTPTPVRRPCWLWRSGADTALTIDRHGPGALTGTVTEDGSGDPVEGVTVTLYEDGGIVSVGSTTTAADGTYTFVEVNSGTFDLEFTATGYDTEWFDNAADAASGSIVIADSTETSSPVTMADAALLRLPGRPGWALSRAHSAVGVGRISRV